ncbi:hypothetical protein ACQEVC_20665 [Plantactinospora sp. CA-294935]|uniref:hypothetical protein n=1 Tax=Plantactinospora sp. CA-294935 TaxID=3240012 RepID=UPI003D8E7F6B
MKKVQCGWRGGGAPDDEGGGEPDLCGGPTPVGDSWWQSQLKGSGALVADAEAGATHAFARIVATGRLERPAEVPPVGTPSAVDESGARRP